MKKDFCLNGMNKMANEKCHPFGVSGRGLDVSIIIAPFQG